MACSRFVSTPSMAPLTGVPTSTNWTTGLFVPRATRAATVDDSKPGALAVSSHSPPRIPRMAQLPF